jgi:hypothetical protein
MALMLQSDEKETVTMSEKIRAILKFMQSQDRNGAWLEWLEKIENKESTFNSAYVFSVLTDWYKESGDIKYIIAMEDFTK